MLFFFILNLNNNIKLMLSDIHDLKMLSTIKAAIVVGKKPVAMAAPAAPPHQCC